jgi:hypothetical protein
MGSLLGVKLARMPPSRASMRAQGSPAAPESPVAATTVTWWSASARSAAFNWLTWAWSTQCSPPIWPAGLREMTPPSEAPARRAATEAATAWSAPSREVALTRRMVSAARGAIVWTISASRTSSP